MSIPEKPAPESATPVDGKAHVVRDAASSSNTKPPSPVPKISTETTSTSANTLVDHTAEFSGDVNTDNTIPSLETLRKIADYPVLDKDGRSRPFKSLYSGPMVARRVLVIFIRHFFCGNCQEFLRSLAASIATDALLQLPVPTFIAVVGCGSPSLIPMYQEVTECPFPIYSDPTKRLYSELGMTRTLTLGPRPEYIRKSLLHGIVTGFIQGLKHVKGGLATKAGDIQQVGGEFLFEPVGGVAASPMVTPSEENGEEKKVTWCHRMRNTRDHAEIPELREVLGLEGTGISGKNKRRWSKALGTRKGTGLSGRTSLSIERSINEKLEPNASNPTTAAI